MAYVKIWLHCVWGTKNRTNSLTNELMSELTNHIKNNAKEKGIYIDIINGHRDHIHCIISLGPDQSLAKFMQLIKGESSFWINKNKLTKYKFEWAVEYYGVSFGESDINKVRHYIRNQKSHHQIQTWDEESKELMEQ
jgi:putative transposase